MEQLPRIKTTTSTDGKKLYWIRTHGRFPWTRVAKWWADVALRNKMARMES